MANNGMSGIISIFGLIFGIFLAVIGIGLAQDLTITLNAMDKTSGTVCAGNPVPIADWFVPEICQDVSTEVGKEVEVTVTGVGMVLLMSMLILIFFVIFSVFIIFLLIPPLREAGLSILLFFSIFFLSAFMLSYFLGLSIVAVF